MSRMQTARRTLRRTLLALTLSAGALLSAPSAAMAQDDESSAIDPRIEGYPAQTALDEGSAALSWTLVGVMLLIGLGVLFKNAKRTHLD